MFRQAHSVNQIWHADFTSLTRRFGNSTHYLHKRYDLNFSTLAKNRQIKNSANYPKWTRYNFREGKFIIGDRKLKLYPKQLELFAIQDRFSRFILHACMKESPTTAYTNYLYWFDTRPCFEETFKRFGHPSELIADPYLVKNPRHRTTSYLLKSNVLWLESANHPAKIASLDSFFARLQYELRTELTPRNIKHYVDYYNFKRPHQALSGYTPACALLCGSEDRFNSFKNNTQYEEKLSLFHELELSVKHNYLSLK